MRSLLQKTDNWPSRGVLILGALLLAGCGGIAMQGVGLKQHFETRIVLGSQGEVYDACRNTLEAMHFENPTGNVGSGKLGMESAVQPGGTAQTIRQRQAKVSVKSVGGLRQEVSIGFWDYSEDVSIGGTVTAGGRLMHGGPLYEAFWQTLDEFKPDVPESDEPADGAESAP